MYVYIRERRKIQNTHDSIGLNVCCRHFCCCRSMIILFFLFLHRFRYFNMINLDRVSWFLFLFQFFFAFFVHLIAAACLSLSPVRLSRSVAHERTDTRSSSNRKCFIFPIPDSRFPYQRFRSSHIRSSAEQIKRRKVIIIIITNK